MQIVHRGGETWEGKARVACSSHNSLRETSADQSCCMAENFEGENFRGCSASLVPRLQAMESWVGPAWE